MSYVYILSNVEIGQKLWIFDQRNKGKMFVHVSEKIHEIKRHNCFIIVVFWRFVKNVSAFHAYVYIY